MSAVKVWQNRAKISFAGQNNSFLKRNFFKTYYWFFWILHYISQSHSSPVPSFLLCNLTPHWIKRNLKTKTNKKSSVEAVVWPSESQSLLFSPYIFTYIHCSESLMWFKAFRGLLLHYQYWGLTGPALGYPVVVPWRSCSRGSAGSAPLHSLAGHRWGGVCCELPHSPGSDSGW